MVKCEYCANYNGKCTEPSGIFYGQKIENPEMDIECPSYLGIEELGTLGGILDGTFKDLF